MRNTTAKNSFTKITPKQTLNYLLTPFPCSPVSHHPQHPVLCTLSSLHDWSVWAKILSNKVHTIGFVLEGLNLMQIKCEHKQWKKDLFGSIQTCTERLLELPHHLVVQYSIPNNFIRWQRHHHSLHAN